MPNASPSRRAGGRSRQLGRFTTRGLCLAAALAVATVPTAPAEAQQGGGFIRDAELEALMRDYATPVLRAAGLGDSNVRVHIINSTRFNAFVMDGRRIFINAGVIMQADTPNEVIGVIAHEAGHIAGGHLARLRSELRNAAAISILSALLGAGAMAAGAMSGAEGSGQAGQAIMLGGRQMAERSLLAYQRSEEQAADRAAVNYLNATSQSAKGMLTTFARFADQSMFTGRHADPYAQSHPMPRERIAALENIARESPHFDRTDPPELQSRHDLAKAKLAGYLDHPQAVARRYPQSDGGIEAHYARTIAQMRTGDSRAALQSVDQLIQANPDYAYFWELKGEMLLRAGRPDEAIEPLRRAASLQSDAPLIRVTLGQALVASGDEGRLNEAIEQLSSALQREPDFADGFRYLAQAYGRAGREADAQLATARGHLASGDYEQAKRFAQRARQELSPGTPAWVQADDIVNYQPPGS